MFDDLWTLADFRAALLAVWTLAVVAGVGLLIAAWRRSGGHTPAGRETAPVPLTLGLVVGVTVLHLAALAFMAQGGVDGYVLYGYPPLVVLIATSAAWLNARAAAVGQAAATAAGVGTVVLALVLYWPDAVGWGAPSLRALWHDRAGAACSWRFAEGFMREYDYGLTRRETTAEAHAITRCRSLTEEAQVLDCIGGIARVLGWRRGDRVPGEPPAALTHREREAYAYQWGTHRRGDVAPCSDFTDPALVTQCSSAVRLECLVFADQVTRYAAGRGLGTPRCDLPAPPYDGYLAAMRRALLARSGGDGPRVAMARAFDADLERCRGVFDACYERTEW